MPYVTGAQKELAAQVRAAGKHLLRAADDLEDAELTDLDRQAIVKPRLVTAYRLLEEAAAFLREMAP